MNIPGFFPGNIKGALIGLKVNGAFIACETGCEFNFEVEMLPSSARTSGRWKESVAGIRGWNMAVNGNLLLQSLGTDIKTVMDAVMTGEEVEIEFRTRSGVSPYFSIKGKALVRSGSVSAPGTGKATWALVFEGTGPFETDFEQFALIINAMPIESDPGTVVNTTKW